MLIGTEEAFLDEKEKVGGNFQVLRSWIPAEITFIEFPVYRAFFSS